MKKLIKKCIASIAIILMIGCASFLSGCIQEKLGTGTIQFLITDKPGDLNITAAWINISTIQVHKSGNNSNAGWITIIEDGKDFDLIQLRNVTEFLGKENLTVGNYTQIRFNVNKANVTIDGDVYNLTIPSKTIKLIKPFNITEGVTTTLILDFDANESIHETGNNKYMFKPTIKVIQQ
jgi:hypothetical protein